VLGELQGRSDEADAIPFGNFFFPPGSITL